MKMLEFVSVLWYANHMNFVLLRSAAHGLG